MQGVIGSSPIVSTIEITEYHMVLPFFNYSVETIGIEGDRAEDEARSRRNPKVELVRWTNSRESVD